jgi:trimeric autotransporter adhesin
MNHFPFSQQCADSILLTRRRCLSECAYANDCSGRPLACPDGLTVPEFSRAFSAAGRCNTLGDGCSDSTTVTVAPVSSSALAGLAVKQVVPTFIVVKTTTNQGIDRSRTSAASVPVETSGSGLRNSSDSGSSSNAALIGGVAGGGVLLALMAGILLVCICRRRRRSSGSDSTNDKHSTAPASLSASSRGGGKGRVTSAEASSGMIGMVQRQPPKVFAIPATGPASSFAPAAAPSASAASTGPAGSSASAATAASAAATATAAAAASYALAVAPPARVQREVGFSDSESSGSSEPGSARPVVGVPVMMTAATTGLTATMTTTGTSGTSGAGSDWHDPTVGTPSSDWRHGVFGASDGELSQKWPDVVTTSSSGYTVAPPADYAADGTFGSTNSLMPSASERTAEISSLAGDSYRPRVSDAAPSMLRRMALGADAPSVHLGGTWESEVGDTEQSGPQSPVPTDAEWLRESNSRQQQQRK